MAQEGFRQKFTSILVADVARESSCERKATTGSLRTYSPCRMELPGTGPEFFWWKPGKMIIFGCVILFRFLFY